MPFFDHLLDSFARHGLFDLRVRAKGDLQVDQHHTVEDVGIVLGQALREAIGDGAGLRRFGSARIPMADARITGRPRSLEPALPRLPRRARARLGRRTSTRRWSRTSCTRSA